MQPLLRHVPRLASMRLSETKYFKSKFSPNLHLLFPKILNITRYDLKKIHTLLNVNSTSYLTCSLCCFRASSSFFAVPLPPIVSLPPAVSLSLVASLFLSHCFLLLCYFIYCIAFFYCVALLLPPPALFPPIVLLPLLCHLFLFYYYILFLIEAKMLWA